MKRRGSVLVVVMIVCVVVGLLGMAMMGRSLHGTRTAAWGRDHVALRLYADSAVDELIYLLNQRMNDPATETFRAVRALTGPGAGLPERDLQLAELPKLLAADPSRPNVTFTYTLTVDAWVPAEPLGAGRGRLAIEVIAKGGNGAAVEKVRHLRDFRVAPSLMPAPMARFSLLIRHPLPMGLFPEGDKNQPMSDALAVTARPGGARTMAEIFLGGDLGAPGGSALEGMPEAMQGMRPALLRDNAHFMTDTPEALVKFVGGRIAAGQSISGLIATTSTAPLNLQLQGFRGRAVIVGMGPVRVGDISVADPSKDALTIVAGGELTVMGTNVNANLISIGGANRSVVYNAQATVTGSVFAQDLKPGGDLSLFDLGFISFAAPAAPVAASPLLALMAPYATDITHARN